MPGMLLASWPVPDPPGTSSNGDSEPASSSDDSSVTPRCKITIVRFEDIQGREQIKEERSNTLKKYIKLNEREGERE